MKITITKKIGGVNLNEDQFRERIINDLEKRGISCINLHRGTFDIYIPIFKKFIECKKVKSFENTPKMSDESGIEFTEYETEALRKLNELQDYNEFPIVPIMDDVANKGSYYLIPPEKLKEHTIIKMKYENHMATSISRFNKPSFSYDDLLNELIKEIKK